MKRFSIVQVSLITVLTVLLIYSPVHAVPNKIVLHIEGMICIAWPSVIKTALEELDGVERACIHFETKKGEIYFDSNKVSNTQIINKMDRIGFKAGLVEEEPSRLQSEKSMGRTRGGCWNVFFGRKKMKRFTIALIVLVTFLSILLMVAPVSAVTDKTVLEIQGMTWPAWPLIIKKALEGLEGVEKASISFKTKRGEVLYDPHKVSETEIVNKVNQIGFKANVIEEKPSRSQGQ